MNYYSLLSYDLLFSLQKIIIITTLEKILIKTKLLFFFSLRFPDVGCRVPFPRFNLPIAVREDDQSISRYVRLQPE